MLAADILVVNQAVSVQPNPALPGSQITASYTVRNAGNVGAPASILRVQVKDATLALVPGLDFDFPTPAIPAGQPVPQSKVFYLPASISNGTYGVYIVLDRYSAVPQNPIANDYGSGFFQLQRPAPPAVTVTSPTAGGTWQAGTAQTVSWSVSGNTSGIYGYTVRLSTNGGGSYTGIGGVFGASSNSITYTPTASQATTLALIHI
jgi:hypothetical protein